MMPNDEEIISHLRSRVEALTAERDALLAFDRSIQVGLAETNQRITAELAEARAEAKRLKIMRKEAYDDRDLERARAATAIALEDAVQVLLAEGWVPVFMRGDQVLTSQRVDAAIAASRAARDERERKETP